MTKHWLKSYDPGVPADIDPKAHASVVALFESAAETYRDNVALECFGQRMTFAALEEKSRAVAAYLQNELGVKKGDRVALMSPNILGFPIAMMGFCGPGPVR